MPYGLETIYRDHAEVVAYGYLLFRGEGVLKELKDQNISFSGFTISNHNVAVVRKGNDYTYNDSINSFGNDQRLEQLIPTEEIFREAKSYKKTNYFSQENSSDCGFCAAYFIIYALGWLLDDKTRKIKDLPPPKTNPFSYVHTNKSNRVKAPMAKTYLELVFYSNCVGLSCNFVESRSKYKLSNGASVSSQTIPLTNTDQKRIETILDDFCIEQSIGQTEKEKIVSVITPLFIRNTKTMPSYNNFALYRNIILYLLLHRFKDVQDLIAKGKSDVLSFANITQLLRDDKIEIPAEKVKEFGTQQGYERFATQSLKMQTTAKQDVKATPVFAPPPPPPFSFAPAHAHVRQPLLSKQEKKYESDKDEKLEKKGKDVSNENNLTITVSRFSTILDSYTTTSRARFFCCVNQDRSPTIRALKSIEETQQGSTIKHESVLWAINQEATIDKEKYKVERDRRMTLFLLGGEGNGTSTDNVIVQLRESFAQNSR